MIRIRHSHPEYEVSGSPAELRFVAERLKRLATAGEEETIACDSAFDPKPYTAVLPKLRLLKKEGKDTVSASPDELTLSGSREGLARIGSFFDMPDDTEDGYHVHHEFFSGNVFVAPDSLPLVITVERTRPNQSITAQRASRVADC
jgi:hypothetical protein